mmetsp:Transcript_33724/g.61071  ORF Transcript_33724/g.61071 Transcript_33724/m.61071 type:complete len:579 (-) Transcript_33724:73-1809(-)
MAMFLLLSLAVCTAGSEELPISAALLDDGESCDASDASDSCHLRLLQRSAVAKMESSESLEDLADTASNSTLDWQSGRETGSMCMLYHCPSTLGPTDCHHWRCICQNGYRWSKLTNKCEGAKSAAIVRDTGGSCWWFGCSTSRGPTSCVHHKCYCVDGFTSVDGKCVRHGAEEEEPDTTTTTSLPPPVPPPEMSTQCSMPEKTCGTLAKETSCCDTGYSCLKSPVAAERVCAAVTSSTEVPRYGLQLNLRSPSNAPLLTFYTYRAQGKTSYPPENVNMASLAGVMWYLNNEIVGRADWGGKRKFDITRILRYKVQTRATQPLMELGMNFGARFAFDSGQCTGPFSCDEAWQNYGYFVGCNRMGPFKGFPFPDFPVAYEGVWYSFPGKCPQMKYFDKTKKGSNGLHCLENQPGGYCKGAPTGAYDCTYNFEEAGEISVDELEGIQDYDKFFNAGGREYDRITDRGTQMTFWDGINDAKKSKWRVDQAAKLFEKHYPGTSLPDNNYEQCDFNYDYFYQKKKCKNRVPGDECSQQIALAKSSQIHQHPEWFPGLTPSSSDFAFQMTMGKSGKTACSIPCLR